eukprot:TRINITY_DN45878_c0_g1_i1.p1 TRINITY_DN45878_c0_g1~~TRINITY_DN45878_c0_g1_i1.p1  ORF type:complete len:257 (-),score=42.54 TRINITY_DN45878_c0_g1_i1:46-792(-)
MTFRGRGLLWVFLIVGCSCAVFLGFLRNNEVLRQRAFAALLDHMKQKDLHTFRPILCEHIESAKGNIVEIGPGTGATILCLQKNPSVTKWTGVEPNAFMIPYLHKEIEKYGVSERFTTDVIVGSAEDMGKVPTASADTVISAHVLCSVKDVRAVLAEVSRVLKPGGKFIFIDHVRAKGPVLKRVQTLVAPLWEILGDGCQFRALWEDYDSLRSLGFEQVDYQLFDAAVPSALAIIKPHIRGIATRGGR